MDDETYVRRRHWSWDEKRAVVEEAATRGNVIGTAKRHGIQAQQTTVGVPAFWAASFDGVCGRVDRF